MHERPTFERLLRIDDDGQRLVLDDHVLDRVHHAVAILADDDGDGVADVVDGPARDRPVFGVLHLDARRYPRHRQRATEVGHVLAGEYGVDPVALPRERGVDRNDLCVRLGRADECRPQRARQHDVVDVSAASGDQSRILLAAHRLPNMRRGRAVRRGAVAPVAHAVTSGCAVAADLLFAASSTARTMLW